MSAQDHLAAPDPLMQSLYYFHVYYQMRRILDELQAPLPQDRAWGAFDNPYDRRVYEQICNEFGVSPHTNWRVKAPNNGLGRVYFYATRLGYVPVGGVSPPAITTQPKCRSRNQQPTILSTWTSSRKTTQMPTTPGRHLSSTSQRGLPNPVESMTPSAHMSGRS